MAALEQKRPAGTSTGQPPLKIVKTGMPTKAPAAKPASAPVNGAAAQKAPAAAKKAASPAPKVSAQKAAPPPKAEAQKAAAQTPQAPAQKAAGLTAQKAGAPVGKAPAPTPAQKAPAKAPMAKVPAPAPAAASAAAKAPAPAPATASTAAEKQAPTGEGKAEALTLSRQDSWAEFKDVDPVYAMIGELQSKKDVISSAGVMDEDVVKGYIQRMFVKGVVQKFKVWHEVWAAMNIPIDMQKWVLQNIVEVGMESELADTVPDILAELVKGHRCKVKAVEEALSAVFECGADQSSCIARFLLLIFPKSPTSEWGWSRVGWNWQQWWGTADKILTALDPSSAFDTLCELLKSIEADSGAYLPHQQIWEPKRLETVRGALCKYGDFLEDELSAAFDMELT